MHIIKQLGIILFMLLLGSLISNSLNINIPGNVIGLILLFMCLCFGIIKIRDVEEVSNFMIKYLSIFFIVPSVGIMIYLDLIKEQFISIIIPVTFSVIIGLLVTGKVVEILLNRKEK